MPKIADSDDMRVALLYPTSQHGNQLRDALKELGASVVYETAAASVDRDALENSGASVVVVNLGPDSDDYIDALYDVLDAGDYNVVFNEANVTEALQGWDHARWARNLASKILKRPDIATPPRPPGAEAVPTPVQTSASFVPVADKPSTYSFDASPTPAAAPAESPTPINLKAVAEKPTMELEVPQEFRLEEPADSSGLDVADLGEFAEGADHIPSAAPAQSAAACRAARGHRFRCGTRRTVRRRRHREDDGVAEQRTRYRPARRFRPERSLRAGACRTRGIDRTHRDQPRQRHERR